MSVDRYCSQKFWWLSIDLEKRQTLSCCAASPDRINFDWLAQNAGKLFNSPTLMQERSMMLAGLGAEVKSCEATCWKAEKAGLSSRRLLSGSDKITHLDIDASPKTLHLIVSTDCNLTCSYCCKQYSSAWVKDINLQGDYGVTTSDDRYGMTDRDRVLINLSQKELAQGHRLSQLLAEISHISSADSLQAVNISGGEPFLYLGLESLLQRIPDTVTCSIWTGLGVNTRRLCKELHKLRDRANLSIVISAENTGQHYEFNRFGNTWSKFISNVQVVKDSGLPYSFNATLSNLTVFDLTNFYRLYQDSDISFASCNDPDFLSMHVMDARSKDLVRQNINDLPHAMKELIESSILVNPSQSQIQQVKSFVLEFSARRHLSLDHFPESFRTWLQKQ